MNARRDQGATLATRCTYAERDKVDWDAQRQHLTRSDYIRQQLGLDPMTYLWIRVSSNGLTWDDDWIQIDGDNWDGTYTPCAPRGETAKPVPWIRGQPYAVWPRGDSAPSREAQLPWTPETGIRRRENAPEQHGESTGAPGEAPGPGPGDRRTESFPGG